MVQDHAAASALLVQQQRFVDLDALRGLKQLDSMRCTLSHLHERYTAWVRLQNKNALDRTVREDKFEKEVRELIQKSSMSFAMLWKEVDRHRRMWDAAESPRMFDTTPLLDDEADKLQASWVADIRAGIAKRKGEMTEEPASHGKRVRNERPRFVSSEKIAEQPQDEQDVEDLVFSSDVAPLKPSTLPETPGSLSAARVVKPPVKRQRATLDPFA